MARILIADDSELMLQQLTAVLGSQPGWSVCGSAANGVSAILKAHELKPDLIILDLVMPMLDGLRTAAEIARILPNVPIVIFSVQVLPELEMEARKYGVWALISKSAHPNLLIETIERLLASSQPRFLDKPNVAEMGVRSGVSPDAADALENDAESDPDPSSELN